MSTSLFRRALATVLGSGLLMLAACGEDEDEDEASPPPTTAAVDDEPAAFCTAAGELVQTFSTGGDPSTALEAAIAAAPDSLGTQLRDLGEQFGAAAQTAAETGDDSAFLAADLRKAAAETFGAMASTCDYQTADLDATEHSFGDVPAELEPALTAFHLANEGEQVHELLLYRRADGATGDLADIVNEDPNVSDGRLDEAGVMLPAGPGEESVLLIDLAPGDYVMVCFIQDGTTSIDQLTSTEGDETTDHRSLGMIDTFSVG